MGQSNEIKGKSFWKDKKNIAIIILSVLLLCSIGIITLAKDANNTSTTNIVSENDDKSELTEKIAELEEENEIPITLKEAKAQGYTACSRCY